MDPSDVRSRFGGLVEADFTIEPSPMTEELRSYWVLNCTQAVLFTQSWYRRRFESHLGLGTFTDVNLYLFPLSSFSLCFCWNLNLILIHTGVTSRQRRVSFFDRISVGSFTLAFWFPKLSSIYLIISFAISVSPIGGRTCHRWFPRSRAQPLGHSDSCKFGVLTQLYIGNPLSK